MELAALHAFAAGTGSSDLPLERLRTSTGIPEADRVAEAARQFEAVLLRQILAAARKTVIKADESNGTARSEIYDDMVNTQLAEAISRSGDFGLARSLQVQLAREATRPGGPAAAPGAPAAGPARDDLDPLR